MLKVRKRLKDLPYYPKLRTPLLHPPFYFFGKKLIKTSEGSLRPRLSFTSLSWVRYLCQLCIQVHDLITVIWMQSIKYIKAL